MKITQLDYSAIMNANSAQMAAETAAQNNRAIAMTNSINMMNQANFERTKKLQEDALAIQASANKTAAITNIINAGLNVAQAGTGLYQSIKQAKYENDIAAYNLANIQNVADFQTLIATAQNLGEFDESGQFKISDELTAYLDKVVTDIQNSDWTIEVKEQALMQWAEIGASASISIAQEYGTRQRESKATLETLELEEIKKGEVLVESGYDAGYSFIDSLSYDSTTKEAMKLQYRTSVDSGRRTNTALALLSSSGYHAAHSYVKDLEGISETERNSLFSTLSSTYEGIVEQTGLGAQQMMSELLKSGKYTASDARELVWQEYGMDRQNADFKKGVRAILDSEQLEWAMSQYEGLSKIDSLTPIELDRLYEDIMTDDRNVFAGIESSKHSLLGAIDTNRIAYQTAMSEDVADFVKGIEDSYTNKTETYLNGYKNQSLSSVDAMRSIREEGQATLRTFAMHYGQFDQATGTVTWADPSLEQVFDQLAERVAKSESKLFIDLVVKDVPEPYRDYVSGSLDSFLVGHFGNDYSYLDMATQAEWDKLEAKSMDSILRYTKATATQDMSISSWDSFLQDLGEEMTKEQTALILDLNMGKQALVTVGADGNISKGNLVEVLNEAENGGEGYVVEHTGGGYSFTGPETEQIFNLLSQQLATDLVARDVISEDQRQALVATPAEDANGELTFAPRLVVDGRVFEFDDNGNPCEVIDGKLVPVGFPERVSQQSSATTWNGKTPQQIVDEISGVSSTEEKVPLKPVAKKDKTPM